MMKITLFFSTLIISSLAFSLDLIVEFKSAPTADQLASYKNIKTIASIEKFSPYRSEYFDRVFQFKIVGSDETILSNDPLINKIEKVFEVEALSVVPNGANLLNDPFYRYQWGRDNQNQTILRDIDDITSQRVESNGTDIDFTPTKYDFAKFHDVVVAVVDSGVDLDHPELKDAIWKNETECNDGKLPFGTLKDLDNNGFAGDCMGWDFTSSGKGSNRAYDDKGHGTHVAGIIAAASNNGTGVAGISSKIKILPLKVIKANETSDSNSTSAFTDRVAKAILYAIMMKADVINLSLGWPKAMDTTYLKEAILEANRKGITIIAAAGNNKVSRPIYPCSYVDVICVGASSIDGSLAPFSNYGGMVDVVAPGEQILSTSPLKLEPTSFPIVGYEIKNGTSQAAPFISALVALMKAQEDLPLSLDHIKRQLFSSSQKGDETLFGNISFDKALLETPGNIVYPNFKQMSDILVDSNKKFSTKFDFNFMFDSELNVSVKIRFQNPEISLNQSEFFIENINGLSSIVLEGQIASWESDAQTKIFLDCIVDGVTYHFEHELYFVRDLSGNEDEFINLILPNVVASEFISTVKGKTYANLRTVNDKYRRELPTYYAAKNSSLGLEVKLFQVQSDREITSYKLQIPSAKKLISIDRFDLNYDGVSDYLIQTVAAEGDKQFIIYSYFDQALRPIIFDGHIKFYPEVAVVDLQNLNFLPAKFGRQNIAVPWFIANGHIPKADQNPDPWADKVLSPANHLYYFQIDAKERSFKTRMFDNYKFEESLSDAGILKWSDDLILHSFAAQSSLDFHGQISRIYFSVGSGSRQRYFMMELSGDSAQFQLKQIKDNYFQFFGQYLVPFTKISQDSVATHAANVLIGMQNNTKAHFTLIAPDNKTNVSDRFSYQHLFERDHILGVLGGFYLDDVPYSFLQTKSNLVLIVDGKSYLRPINRVSFVPGQVFNEMFFPLVTNYQDSLKPSFYIDATSLEDRHIYTVVATEEGLITPLSMNIQIPKNCASLNPTKLGSREALALACDVDKNIVLKFMELK